MSFYVVLIDDRGTEMVKIPWSTDDSPICHITLFTSFDLKRCNKPLFKKYEASSDKLVFLSDECGEANALMIHK